MAGGRWIWRTGFSFIIISSFQNRLREVYNFFSLYMPLADSWMLFNNAAATPELIAKGEKGDADTTVQNEKLFAKIKKVVNKP